MTAMVEMDLVSRKILRELSMDARIPISRLAKVVGVARSTLIRRLKFLEREMGLKFTAEFDQQKLGLQFCYLIGARLRKEIPQSELLKRFSNSTIPQFVTVCKGEFDLLIYAVAKTQLEYLRWEYYVRSSLEDALISWKASHMVFVRHGFFPLRGETLIALNIPPLEKKMLIELNNDARISFRDLARKTGCSVAQVRYGYRKLLKSGLIKRFTVLMRKPPLPGNVAYFLNYTFRRDHEELSMHARHLILNEPEFQPENTYCMVTETSGTADGFDWVAADDQDGAYRLVKEVERIYQGSLHTESATITKPILGLLPVRTLDMKKTYDTSSWEQG